MTKYGIVLRRIKTGERSPAPFMSHGCHLCDRLLPKASNTYHSDANDEVGLGQGHMDSILTLVWQTVRVLIVWLICILRLISSSLYYTATGLQIVSGIITRYCIMLRNSSALVYYNPFSHHAMD